MLVLVGRAAPAAGTELSFDSRALVEVHTLDAIPKEVIALLGWDKREGPDGISASYREFNETDAAGSKFPRRYFESAGVCSAGVVVLYEEAGRPPSYHAIAFEMTRTGWSKVREWAFDENLDLRSFLYTVDSAHYPQAQYYLRSKRRQRVAARIRETQPGRRDAPLRKTNLSDNEAREIQYVMAQVYPGVILNISGVVEGCPCEEGAFCSDQVWIVPRYDPNISGVSLSRINGHWAVGPIQQWWIDRAKLEADTHLTPNHHDALDSLWEQFPACVKTPSTK
jgi:hypothetical protein